MSRLFSLKTMKKITAITAQKRNADRVSVFLDGEFAFGLPLEAATHLREGQELSASEIAELQAHDAYAKAKEDAMRLIALRPRSIAEIQRSLRRKGVEEPQIDRVINRLQEIELLNDEAFARYWVDQRETFKPRSHLALRQELMQKGVNRHIIDRAVADVDERKSAFRLAEKRALRWQHLPYDAFRKKMAGFLQRRGFNYEIIREVTDEIWRDVESHM